MGLVTGDTKRRNLDVMPRDAGAYNSGLIVHAPLVRLHFHLNAKQGETPHRIIAAIICAIPPAKTNSWNWAIDFI